MSFPPVNATHNSPPPYTQQASLPLPTIPFPPTLSPPPSPSFPIALPPITTLLPPSPHIPLPRPPCTTTTGLDPRLIYLLTPPTIPTLLPPIKQPLCIAHESPRPPIPWFALPNSYKRISLSYEDAFLWRMMRAYPTLRDYPALFRFLWQRYVPARAGGLLTVCRARWHTADGSAAEASLETILWQRCQELFEREYQPFQLATGNAARGVGAEGMERWKAELVTVYGSLDWACYVMGKGEEWACGECFGRMVGMPAACERAEWQGGMRGVILVKPDGTV